MNNKKIILAPRSFAIIHIQYFGLIPLFISIAVILATITSIPSDVYLTSKDLLSLTILMGLPLTVSFIIFYFPQKYITRLVINEDKNIIEKVKKGQADEVYEFNSVKDFTSKLILAAPCQYKLFMNKIDGDSVEIFNEYPLYGGRNWIRFAEKLSVIINKPLKKEIWHEDFDGKLSLISPKTIQNNKKKGVYRLVVPLCISLLGAVYFKVFPSTRAFIFAGLVTVLINISISFYYVLKNRKDFGKLSDNTFVLVIYVLTLLIPYFGFFMLFVYLLNIFPLIG